MKKHMAKTGGKRETGRHRGACGTRSNDDPTLTPRPFYPSRFGALAPEIQQLDKSFMVNRLFKAIREVKTDAVEKLCAQKGSLLLQRNSAGLTPIHHAFDCYINGMGAHRCRLIIRYLIQACPESLLEPDSTSRLAIHIVAAHATAWRSILSLLQESEVCWGMGKRDGDGRIPLEVALHHRSYPEAIEILHQMTVRELGPTSSLFLMHSAVRFRSPLLLLTRLGLLEKTSTGQCAAAARYPNGDYPLHVELQSSRPRWAIVQWLERQYPNAAMQADSKGDLPLIKVCQHDFSLTMVYSILRECPDLAYNATSTEKCLPPAESRAMD